MPFAVIYPQLDGVRINENRTLPIAVIQAIRKSYDYIAQLSAASQLSAVVIQNTHQNRLILFPAINQALGSFYIETDRQEALYVAQEVVGVQQWVLVVAALYGVFADRPSDLGPFDSGFYYSASDALDYRWDGTSWVTLDTVRGGLNLLNPDAIPRVDTVGTLDESALTDDGTVVESTEPIQISMAVAGLVQPQLVIDDTVTTGLTRFGRVVAGERADLFINLTYDGSDFLLDDTGANGLQVTFTSTGAAASIVVYPAGANPRTGLGQLIFQAQLSGDTAVSGSMGVGSNYRVAGTQVVGAQLSAVAAPAGGAVIDVQARAAIVTLISRLQTHGLTA